MITVQLLGGASLRSGDAPLVGPPAQRHRIALLALVAASWPQPLSRDRAMALLWPERDLTNARRLLNLAVHVLRAALGEGAIASAGDGLLLDPSHVRCDVHALRVAIAEHDAERTVRLYTGPLLDGFHLAESAEFAYWLDERRAELAHDYLGALLALAERQERSGDVHGRVGTCLRLVAVDPHSRVYARALMRALDAAGDPSAAIRHSIEHAQRLRADLDLDPDPEIVALAEQMRAAAARRQAAPPVAHVAPTTSVAVLPFIELSADRGDDYFADGITEDVIAHLSKIRALTVISRSSVMPFTQRDRNLAEIARALGATTLLDGSMRRAGDRVRIVAQLVDVASGRIMWAETYDRQITDIFVIQSDVALHIAAALRAELSRDEQVRVQREPTRDVRAYTLFLQGRRWFIEFTPDSLVRAVECFNRAVARDPAFALAHASLAMASVELAEHGSIAPRETLERGADAARTALALDPELGAAHCAMGHVATVREFDWAGAERAFRRAIELSPSNADAHDLYGRLCSALGRHDEALALLKRAQELDPLAHRVDVATTLLRAGRHDEAAIHAAEAVEVDPRHHRSRATLGWALFFSGRQDVGVAELERAVAQSPGDTIWLGQLGEAYGLAGRTAKARKILRDLEARARDGYVSPYHLAYVHTGLGDFERAIELLERAVEEHAGGVYGIKGSFLFAPLRAHSRFASLMQRMNLA